MILREQVWSSLRNLFHHKVRALLTMLGMVFGVAAVIAMIAISEGARAEVLASISDLGVDCVLIHSVKPSPKRRPRGVGNLLAYGITFKDRAHILGELPDIAGSISTRDIDVKLMTGGVDRDQRVIATSPGFARYAHLTQRSGRFLCALDQEQRLPVVVLGMEVARALFPCQDPLGKRVTLKRVPFQVIGIFSARHGSGAGGISADQLNHSLLVPEESARERLGLLNLHFSQGSNSYERQELGQLVVNLAPGSDVVRIGRLLRRIITQAHPEGDAEVVVPLELLEQKRRTQRTFTIIMSSIASISLLVGGIGITNIMLASVLERTREIGIRRAVGARQRDILLQFLLETVLMSLIGGIAGILLGMVAAYLVSHLASWPVLITAWSVALSLGISLVVGLLAGVSPAITAARLPPVVALRHA